MSQFLSEFEFTEDLLVFLLDEFYHGRCVDISLSRQSRLTNHSIRFEAALGKILRWGKFDNIISKTFY